MGEKNKLNFVPNLTYSPQICTVSLKVLLLIPYSHRPPPHKAVHTNNISHIYSQTQIHRHTTSSRLHYVALYSETCPNGRYSKIEQNSSKSSKHHVWCVKGEMICSVKNVDVGWEIMLFIDIKTHTNLAVFLIKSPFNQIPKSFF